MRLSRTLKSSPHSLPSPDGALIATILSSKLSIRSTRSLETTRVIGLPSELAASISWFLWSPSSIRVLVGTSDHIRVYSTADSNFDATIAHPVSVTRATYVCFGASDSEVLVFSDFGLKLSVFNIRSSKSVDINSPKFFHPGIASKGYSYRPQTSHLALLTRNGGKDIISIHSPHVLEIVRSWCPDTIDAQGVQWSPDGRWLVTWESASQGHRILMYTSDGHLFKSWNGPLPVSDEDIDAELGAGIRLLEWSNNGTLMAAGDHSRRVIILSAPGLSESINLLHPTAVKPADTLQVWQEQFSCTQLSSPNRDFVKATQTICPPTSSNTPPSVTDSRTGTNILTFDGSNTLLATRTEDMPSTLWIWDLGTRILRAVLILHAPIAKATWHPSIHELLLIRCEGDENRGLAHVWEPSWESPKVLDFTTHIPGGKVLGRTVVRWINMESQHPAVFFSDSQDCMLASLSGSDDGNLPWSETTPQYDIRAREESPLDLVPSSKSQQHRRSSIHEVMDHSFTSMSAGSEEMEDTFQFRKFMEPKGIPKSRT